MSALFAGTFPAGFERDARAALPALLPVASVERAESGLLFFRAKEGAEPARLPIFHSVFHVLRRFPGGATFPKMASQAKACRFSEIGKQTGTFRVRWSRENRFAAVPGNVAQEAERAIARGTGLVPDRSLPNFEFWFVIRREGGGFFGFLLPKEDVRVPEKGELRPELAHLALRFAGMQENAVFCDPFAGHGALPRAALEAFSPKAVYISDRDPALAEWLRAQPVFSPPAFPVPADARHLSHIPDGAVDFLVTDPPWGLFREEGDLLGLYRAFLSEAARILRPMGVLCVLTAKKEEFAALLSENADFAVEAAADILVNGKKARIFRAVRKDRTHG